MKFPIKINERKDFGRFANRYWSQNDVKKLKGNKNKKTKLKKKEIKNIMVKKLILG